MIAEVVDRWSARAAASSLGLANRAVRRVLAERATPAQAALLAERAGVARLVPAGVAPGSTPDARGIALAGDRYSGQLTVGHDLDTL